jgi:hypothetical protein
MFKGSDRSAETAAGTGNANVTGTGDMEERLFMFVSRIKARR